MALPIMRARRAGTWPLGSPLTSCPPQNRAPRRISRALGKEKNAGRIKALGVGSSGSNFVCAWIRAALGVWYVDQVDQISFPS
jgi:hypothetical protein